MIKVYSELSLDKESIRRILPEAQVSSPIARGDLALDIRNGIGVVIIIDGTFHQNLAVAADEIMTALRSGIKVYGSSSMGAMRASELRDFGMIGYGQIYEHILTSPTFRDDFLAQTFHEHRGTLRASSYPYIDFYMNLLTLERKKLIKKRDAQRLLELYGKVYYPERCWPTLRDILLQEKASDHLVALARKACTAMPVQKRIDAIGLLKLVRKQLSQADAINRAINLRHGLPSP
jgi:TfuA protein